MRLTRRRLHEARGHGAAGGGEAMTTIYEVIRAAIPEADGGLCEMILWGRTPFPAGRITARRLFRAASGWQRAQQQGYRLCEWCERRVWPSGWTCERCDAVLSRVRP